MNDHVLMDELLRALAGGTLIGLAAGAMLVLSGRIAGISGIYGGMLRPSQPSQGDVLWRLLFLAGLITGGLVLRIVSPESMPMELHVSGPHGAGLMVIAGLLVGFGTRLGSGCTSGHGVCGVSRGSVRSLVATGTFMFTAMITVWVIKHVLEG
jgi:uncharacterized protein